MRAIGFAFVALFLLAGGASAAEGGWRDQNGKPVANSDARKSSKEGFAGQLLITSDADWREKWERPETPRYSTTDKVKLGQTVAVLILFVNPGLDDQGNAKVLCDIRVVRPDGSVSTEQKALVCAEGRMAGGQYLMRLANVTPGFRAEAGDPPGTWTFEVNLNDAVRDVKLALKARLEFEPPPAS